MNIFITGGSGFLGKALLAFLKSNNLSIVAPTSAECNLLHRSDLDAFRQKSFDLIFHLAAWTQAGDFCLRHPGEQWLMNQQINTNVLDWWQKSQPQAKLVAIGTSCSYDPLYPLTEENYLLGSPIESLYTYAMTKRMLLCGLKALHKQFGLDYLYLVPSTLYGSGYHTDGRQLHFIFDLVRKILSGKLYGESVVLWGDGEQKRELVPVRDFVQTMWDLTSSQKNQVINIGSGKEHSIKEFARFICSFSGYSFDQIQFDTTRYVGAKSKILCIDKLQSILPNYQTTPLESGIEEVVQWFSEHYFSQKERTNSLSEDMHHQ